MCTGMILSNYKFFVNPLFKLISIEHVIIGSKTQWKHAHNNATLKTRVVFDLSRTAGAID